MKWTRKEYEKIFKTYYNPLANYANSILNDDSLAEDVVQEVLIHLWEAQDKIQIKQSLKHFLFTAIRNKSIDSIRKKKTSTKRTEDYKFFKEIREDVDSIAQKYMYQELLTQLIRQLPKKCGEVFVLNKRNGLTFEEIAESQGLSVKTVENHVYRAIKLLRQMAVDSTLVK